MKNFFINSSARYCSLVAHELLNSCACLSSLHRKEDIMLSWAVTFLIVALIAGILGFTGVAGAASNIAWILFVVFLVAFVLSLLTGRGGSVV
jgi:uncharacterized membrane protein YtjA (UPF0391 family)